LFSSRPSRSPPAEEGEVTAPRLGMGILDVHQDCRSDIMSVDSRKGNFGSEVGEGEEGLV